MHVPPPAPQPCPCSLGGAVATLCAFDIERELQDWGYATVPSPFSAVAAVPERAGNCQSGGGGSGSNPGGARGRPVSVTCYTYGAPRTGNHAFANEMVERVPDTWAVINDQDLGEHWWWGAGCLRLLHVHGKEPTEQCEQCHLERFAGLLIHNCHKLHNSEAPPHWSPPTCHPLSLAVAKAGKFLFLFKRCGHVTLINPEGDLIVNPSERDRSRLGWCPIGTLPFVGAAETSCGNLISAQGTASTLPTFITCLLVPSQLGLPSLTLAGFLELNVQRSSYHASVSQHLLLSYNKSLAAILRGQHEGKSIR